jgi:hypothetical protein
MLPRGGLFVVLGGRSYSGHLLEVFTGMIKSINSLLDW